MMIKYLISRIKIAFGILLNGRYIEEYNNNLAMLKYAENTLFEACREFEQFQMRLPNEYKDAYLANANNITLNEICLPIKKTLGPKFKVDYTSEMTLELQQLSLREAEAIIAEAKNMDQAYHVACEELVKFAYINNLVKVETSYASPMSRNPHARLFKFTMKYYR